MNIFSKKKENNLYLDEVIKSVGTSVVDSKLHMDIDAITKRRKISSKDPFINSLPIITFKISDVEIELKFVTKGVGENSLESKRLIISTDPSDIAESENAVCTLKFRLDQKIASQYQLSEDSENMIKHDH